MRKFLSALSFILVWVFASQIPLAAEVVKPTGVCDFDGTAAPCVEFKSGSAYALEADFSAEFRQATSKALVAGSCVPDATTLCLNSGRFLVVVHYRTGDNRQGSGQVDWTSGSSGGFWFFEAGNVEMTIKVITACSEPFNAFWVFGAAMTDVEYTLEVFDTYSREVRIYYNPLGQAAPVIQDTRGFKTCATQRPAQP